MKLLFKQACCFDGQHFENKKVYDVPAKILKDPFFQKMVKVGMIVEPKGSQMIKPMSLQERQAQLADTLLNGAKAMHEKGGAPPQKTEPPAEDPPADEPPSDEEGEESADDGFDAYADSSEEDSADEESAEDESGEEGEESADEAAPAKKAKKKKKLSKKHGK